MLGGQTVTLCLLTYDGGQGTKKLFANYYLLNIIVKIGLINPIGKIISIINSDVTILFMTYVQIYMYSVSTDAVIYGYGSIILPHYFAICLIQY